MKDVNMLRKLIEKNKVAVEKFLADGTDLPYDVYEEFFTYCCDENIMPYGVAKARTGDPYEFIYNLIEKELAWAL